VHTVLLGFSCLGMGISYFFTVEDLAGRAEAVGMEVLECEYACVINQNRKSGKEMKRAFVHGVFRKPLPEGAVP